MKLKHPKRKGNLIRSKGIKELEADGWQVGIVERTGRFIKEKDLFGLWDVIALKVTSVSFIEFPIIKFIQFKSAKPNIKSFQQFANTYRDLGEFEIWIWHNREGFEKVIL